MEKKEAIRRASAKIIAREGFFNTKMQAIADEAGIAVGTIYNYFRNKEEILDYIFTYEQSKRLELLEKFLICEMPLKESIERFITAHINWVKDNLHVAKVLIQEELTPLTNRRKAIKESCDKLKNTMELFIIKEQKKGVINKNYNARFLSEILFYTFRSLTTIICDRLNDIDLEDAKKHAVSFIINGLK